MESHREMEEEREREIDIGISDLLNHFPSAHNSEGWTRPSWELGTQPRSLI